MSWKLKCLLILLILQKLELTIGKLVSHCCTCREKNHECSLCLVAQGCLQSDNGTIPFRDLGGGVDSERVPTGRQVIITSYQFQCCGNITRWRTYTEPGGGGHDGDYNIRFQVWRQGPEVEINGCYSLVAEDRYDSIPLGQGGLVDRTVPGDVLGYFMTDGTRNDGRREGIQLEEREDDDGERVWYNSRTLVTTGDPCPFPVGGGRILDTFTNSAPVISIDIGKLP